MPAGLSNRQPRPSSIFRESLSKRKDAMAPWKREGTIFSPSGDFFLLIRSFDERKSGRRKSHRRCLQKLIDEDREKKKNNNSASIFYHTSILNLPFFSSLFPMALTVQFGPELIFSLQVLAARTWIVTQAQGTYRFNADSERLVFREFSWQRYFWWSAIPSRRRQQAWKIFLFPCRDLNPEPLA